jgi:hypothetical protein
MSGRMPNERQLARVLREHLPDRATSGLDGRIMASVDTTPQRRRMPVVVASLLAGEPHNLQALVLVVAALLLTLPWRQQRRSASRSDQGGNAAVHQSLLR